MEVTLKKVKNGYMASNGEEETFVEEVCPAIAEMFEGEMESEEPKEDKTESRIKRLSEELEGKPKAPKYVDMGEPGIEKTDGPLHWVRGFDRYEGFTSYYYNLVPLRPNANGIIVGIRYPLN